MTTNDKRAHGPCPGNAPGDHVPLLSDVAIKGADVSQCAIGMLDSLEVIFEGIRSLARESGRDQIAQLAMVGSELVDGYHDVLRPVARQLQEIHDDAKASQSPDTAETAPAVTVAIASDTAARIDSDYHCYQIKQLAAQLEILHTFALRHASGSILADGIGVALDLAAKLECEVAESADAAG